MKPTALSRFAALALLAFWPLAGIPAGASPAWTAAIAAAAPVTAIGASAPGSPVAPNSWDWPVGSHADPPHVLRHFDAPETTWGPGHRGVDLAAAEGSEVRSPAAGTVAFVGVVVDRPVLTVDHGGGLVSSFEPLDSTLTVGESVIAGQVLGTIAAGGHRGDGGAHWGLRLNNVYVDPLPTVRDLRPSVLLPLPG